MSRPIKFEDFRYVGDKRTQWYFDLDDPDLDQEMVAELMEAEHVRRLLARHRRPRPATAATAPFSRESATS